MIRNDIAVALIFIGLIGCSDSNLGSGCEDARNQMIASMTTICGESAYSTSQFCQICFKNGYYATTGPADCRCSRLTFEQDACLYATGNDALSGVRDAIDWADSVCNTFSLPGVDAGSASSNG